MERTLCAIAFPISDFNADMIEQASPHEMGSCYAFAAL